MCPGAPFLLPGVADALARRVPDLLAACRSAVDAVRDVDAILLLTAARAAGSAPAAGAAFPAGAAGAATDGRRGTDASSSEPPSSAASVRVLPPGTVLGADGFRRSDRTDEPARHLLPARLEHRHPQGQPATGVLLGAALLADAGIEVPVIAVEITGSGRDAARDVTRSGDLADLVDPDDERRVGIVVIADGSACHGDAAPGRANDAAPAFDAALADALKAGDPSALAAACADRDAARILLATVEPLAALAWLAAGHSPRHATLLYSAAPFGVGYLAAVWQW